MSYNTKYIVPFKSVGQADCIVEIQEENFEGLPVELAGGRSTFVVSIDEDDFLYTPVRFSTATLKLVGDDRLQDLFSTAYQQFRINFKRNGVVEWTGFISPEVYTQEFSSLMFEIELQCVSAMSVLENIDYKCDGDKYAFVSLLDIIKKGLELSKGSYQSVYLPDSYSFDAESSVVRQNILSEIMIDEQNFFDEDDKAMTMKEVMEEVCRFLHWTCSDWKGDLYFVDIDNTSGYYKYNPEFIVYSVVATGFKTVQEIGCDGSEHTLDILGGYNKVKIRTSNYSVNESFPEEDIDSLTSIGQPHIIQNDSGKMMNEIFLRSDILTPHKYKLSNGEYVEIKDSEVGEGMTNYLGAFQVKRCCYDLEEQDGKWVPTIRNYNYEDMIRIRTAYRDTNTGKPVGLGTYLPILTYNPKHLPRMYSNCALSINCSLQFARYPDMDPLGSFPEMDGLKDASYGLCCKLSIGDNYWNGKKWSSDPESHFTLYFGMSELIQGGTASNDKNKTIYMPYNGLDGYIIEIMKPLTGELKFEIKSDSSQNNYEVWASEYKVSGYYLSGLKIGYQDDDLHQNKNSKDSDRVYENVVNDEFINDFDEIELKISTYNNDGLCYSKVLHNGDYLQTVYSHLENKQIRPEELLINRIVDQYKTPKIKLSYILNYDQELSPIITMLDSQFPEKSFIPLSGEIDFEMEQFTLKLIENARN